MRFWILLALLLAVSCTTGAPQRFQVERLRAVYLEDTTKAVCAPGDELSGKCIPKARQDAGDRLFEEALKAYDSSQ